MGFFRISWVMNFFNLCGISFSLPVRAPMVATFLNNDLTLNGMISRTLYVCAIRLNSCQSRQRYKQAKSMPVIRQNFVGTKPQVRRIPPHSYQCEKSNVETLGRTCLPQGLAQVPLKNTSSLLTSWDTLIQFQAHSVALYP